MNSNPKILYVVTHMPCPPSMGAHHRVLNIGCQLKKCGEVRMVYVGKDFSLNSFSASRNEFGEIIVMKPQFVEGPDVVSRLRYKLNYHWPRHYAYQVSAPQRKEFKKLLREHDVVWFHTLAAADCFGGDKYDNSVMDLDDLNWLKFELKAKVDRGLRLKIANLLLIYKWRRRERRALERFSAVTVCSRDDKAALGPNRKIYVVPNGFESPSTEPIRRAPQHLRLGFIGNLSYGPNADGLKWFGKEIWPLITKEVPQAKLRIVGILTEKNDCFHESGYERLGFLEDVKEEFHSWSALIVPLRYGGGTRLKIIEALSKKCPIVSTAVGAHGLELTHEKNVMLAEQPQDFARACIRLLQDVNYGKKLTQAGWSLFKEKYTWNEIGKTIKKAVYECLSLK